MEAPTPTAVEIFVDPMCPFAWLTSRWLAEVERLGRIHLTVRIMSLSILNEGREDVSDFYRQLVDRAWPPARIAIAVERDHGSDAVRAWYDELGCRTHIGGDAADEGVLAETLETVGLPDGLLGQGRRPTGTDPDPDEIERLLRASHQRAIDSVGDEVGTPVVHFAGDDSTIAFFGPVVNPAPREDEALRLWDGVELVARTPGFFELKRTRTGPLVFS